MYQTSGQADPPHAGTVELPCKLGRYELLARLATGGMGEIYLARLQGEGGFEKLIVLKLLLPELVADARFVDMFLDEARIAARLSHPNVCEVYELGREEHRYFIAMQYLQGVPLSRLIQERDAATPPEEQARLCAGLVAQASEGLHHAHELRGPDGEPLCVVHRDVSPSNLFVTTEGVVKVVDFGIVKARGSRSHTARDEIKGKYAYMSPEQLRGAELDRRSDVFSLGIVLWEALTGRPLFDRPSDFLTAKAILEEPIPRPSDLEPAVPEALSAAAVRALSRRADDRFQSARELGAAVEEALKPLGGPPSPAAVSTELERRFASELREQERAYEDASALAQRSAARLEPGEAASRADTTATTRRYRLPLRPRQNARGWALTGVVALVSALIAGSVATLVGEERDEVAAVEADAAGAEVEERARKGKERTEEDRTDESRTDEKRTDEKRTDEKRTDEKRTDESRTDESRTDKKRTDEKRTTPERTARSGVDPPREETRPVGYLSIESKPYATIYVDGRRVGVTPLIRQPVAAGEHRVRAVLESGEARTFSVKVPPGKTAPPRHLYW